LLLALGSVLWIFSWRRLGLAIYILVAVLYMGIGSGLPAKVMLDDLQNGYASEARTWGTHNLIVVLGAGSIRNDVGTEDMTIFGHPRLLKAFELYRSCKTKATDCRIVASGGDPQPFGSSEAEIFGNLLQKLGVPAHDVLLEKQSLNTWQNAQFTAALVDPRQFDRTYLVSSGLHVKRGTLYFSHFGIRAIPIRADYVRAGLSVLPVAYNFMVTDVAIHEYLGIWRYYIYNLFGWNVKATAAQSV
jgi:uncharacterized SAM-binding protein YcdF (DUF218 family)